MRNTNATTRSITLSAMGIALFVVLSLCLQVPVFENYYLCLGYVVMAVYCYCFGPMRGTIVGTLGVVLYCVVISGLRGMPGWALANVVIGVGLGQSCLLTKKIGNVVLRQILLMGAIVLFTALGVLGVKSLTECALYAQPFLFRAAKNMTAFIADVVVLWVGILICPMLSPLIEKLFPEEYKA